jgi:guanylate kinase
LIFITAPNLKELSNRLYKRCQDNESVIKLRLKNAKRELKHISRYDYVIVNDNINKALKKFEKIYIEKNRKNVSK